MFFMKRLFFTILAFSNSQTSSFINGTPTDAKDSSAKIADTKSEGLFNWIPKWCKNRYDDLFGNHGVITSVVSGVFGRSENVQTDNEYCCRLFSNDESATRNEIRGVPDKENADNCPNAVGTFFEDAGTCVLGAGWICGRFVKKAGLDFVSVLGVIFVYLPVRGCGKLINCFPHCESKKKTKPPKN